MVGNIGAAISAIIFPLMLTSEGSANRFFILAAVLNGIAILSWLIMNPNRKVDHKLSPAAVKTRFIAILTSLVLITAGAVGFNVYRSVKRTKAAENAKNTSHEMKDGSSMEQKIEAQIDSTNLE